MSSLRDRLARLERDAAKRAAAVAPPQTPSANAAPSGPPSLDELATRLAEAVGAARPAPETAGCPAGPIPLAAIGFEGSDALGWARRRSLPLAARIGQAPLAPSATADAHLLGLLALTPALSSCSPERALYLDTETTGLGGAGTLAFLVGMAWVEPARASVELEQWLLASPAHEPTLLAAVHRRMVGCEFVVSYNGRAFDLPLLRSRRVMNALVPMPERPQLDLLHLVRRVHRHRRWRKTLGGVEQHVLDFDRGPDVAGADVAQIYHHFMRSADAACLRPVVTHNEHDVLTMVALVGLYGEPLGRLGADDLASLARTIGRAGELARAARIATEAVRRQGGAGALRARAEIAKARGDKQLALSDFEQLAAEVDDPSVRLELAKLYEHYVRDPIRALAVATAGTGEDAAALERRTGRLERKIARARARTGGAGPRRGWSGSSGS